MGKFLVKSVPSGIKFDLAAANGEVIGTSEVYTNLKTCLGGIESVRRNALKANLEDLTAGEDKVLHPKFQIYEDKSGQYRFRLKASNGQNILASEAYTTKAACLHGIDSVRANAAEAQVIDK